MSKLHSTLGGHVSKRPTKDPQRHSSSSLAVKVEQALDESSDLSDSVSDWIQDEPSASSSDGSNHGRRSSRRSESIVLAAQPVPTGTRDWREERIASFRRPVTTDATRFWFCKPDLWNQWLSEAGSGSTNAMNRLSKSDAAGRMMEKDQGVEAAESCSFCSRVTHTEPCMVYREQYADHKKTTCAFCRRNGKAGCTASRTARPPTIEDRVAALDARFENLQPSTKDDRIAALESRLEALEEVAEVKLATLKQRIQGLEAEIDSWQTTSNVPARIVETTLEVEDETTTSHGTPTVEA